MCNYVFEVLSILYIYGFVQFYISIFLFFLLLFMILLSYSVSGKLHNLARALADEEEDTNHAREDIFYSDRKVFENSEKNVVLGVGLRAMKASSTSLGGEESEATIKDSAKRVFGSLSVKPVTYLSAFILYIASIGDVVDGTDTTHDFNFFSVVFEWPKDVSFLFFNTSHNIVCASRTLHVISGNLVFIR